MPHIASAIGAKFIAFVLLMGGCVLGGCVPSDFPAGYVDGNDAADPLGQLARCRATGLSREECCASHEDVPACQ